MKIIIGVLLIGLLIGVSTGAYQLSFTSFSGFDSTMLVNVVDGAFNYGGKAVETLIAFYQNITESSRIVYFFNNYLPPDLNPGTIVFLGFGVMGLWGYGRRRMKK